MAVCGLFAISGCSSAVAVDDSAELAKVEAQNWPKCTEVSERTVYDAFFEGDEFAERMLLAGRVSTIAAELEKSRDSFQETGEPMEIFPLLLYFQTSESLEFAMKPKLVHKTEFLKIVINTYDAYKVNRDAFNRGEPDSVDKQWRAYFDAAVKAKESGKWSPEQGVDILLDGVNAHVFYDLPRAVRDVIKKSDAERGELTQDFKAADSVYPVAEEALKREILKHFESENDRERAQKLFGNGAEYVSFSRSKAWEMGIGNGPLGNIEEQPHLVHDPSSRKYFPKELIERGICR